MGIQRQNIYICVRMYVYIFIYMAENIHMCMYVYTHMYTHMCMYMYIYISPRERHGGRGRKRGGERNLSRFHA